MALIGVPITRHLDEPRLHAAHGRTDGQCLAGCFSLHRNLPGFRAQEVNVGYSITYFPSALPHVSLTHSLTLCLSRNLSLSLSLSLSLALFLALALTVVKPSDSLTAALPPPFHFLYGETEMWHRGGGAVRYIYIYVYNIIYTYTIIYIYMYVCMHMAGGSRCGLTWVLPSPWLWEDRATYSRALGYVAARPSI